MSRERNLPKCAQKRLISLRLAIDDAEAQRYSLQKRRNTLDPNRPDEADELAMLDDRMSNNTAALMQSKGLMNHVDAWLQGIGAFHHVSPTPLEPAAAVKPRDIGIDRLEQVRSKVKQCKDGLLRVGRAPAPFENVEAALRSLVAGWGREGAPSVTLSASREVSVSWGPEPPSAFRVAAWLDPDRMLQRLTDQARAKHGVLGDAIPAGDRTDMLAKLRADLFKAELEEVALVDALIESGKTGVQHRLDVNPAALLGVLEPKGIRRTELVA